MFSKNLLVIVILALFSSFSKANLITHDELVFKGRYLEYKGRQYIAAPMISKSDKATQKIKAFLDLAQHKILCFIQASVIPPHPSEQEKPRLFKIISTTSPRTCLNLELID